MEPGKGFLSSALLSSPAVFKKIVPSAETRKHMLFPLILKLVPPAVGFLRLPFSLSLS